MSSTLRILWYWMRGVRFVSIKGVYVGKNVWIMPGAVIYPNTYIDGYSFVGSGAVVLPNARIVDSVILPGGQIGCEITRSVTGYNTSSKHQGTYIGDAVIGNNCNIGAGTVFCNYDGYKKSMTVLEDRVFIGSGNMIIAPRTIGENSSTGAGSVLTKDIPKGETWVGSPARKKEQ